MVARLFTSDFDGVENGSVPKQNSADEQDVLPPTSSDSSFVIIVTAKPLTREADERSQGQAVVM
ncbi:hypothetical protein EYF80_030463 [Liparis tanakae]|uniref:Uncharacterized protein n=1 Tax=Liparis tanakae TaxID=230148 RepID=A0A4Z2H0J6_9TELE|nr:hypothetical protein EYF80_030463 [Liparis tanakae]